MIVSASRRCDIPSYNSDWLARRLAEGECEAVNPYNPNMRRRVSLRPNDVDALILWSKNPLPLLARADALNGYAWVLQYTLNDAPDKIEPNLPDLSARIDAFLRFSRLSSPSRVVWRYDPAYIAGGMSADDNIKKFKRIADALSGATDTCVISFLDIYAHVSKRLNALGVRPPTVDEAKRMAAGFVKIAAESGMRVQACCEALDLSAEGVEARGCIDAASLSRALNKDIRAKRDSNQRENCLCSASVDIGRYGICQNGCAYCYANKFKEPRRGNPPDSLSL